MDEIRELHRPLIAGLLSGLLSAMTVMDVLHAAHFAMGLICLALVLFSLLSKHRIFTLSVAASSTATIVLDLVATGSTDDVYGMLVMTERAVALVAIWLVVLLKHLPTQADKTLESLYGSLIVCEECKRVSDRPGDWSTSEMYLRQRTSLEFRSSLCPSCCAHWNSPVRSDTQPSAAA
jgi:hypothetical protein